MISVTETIDSAETWTDAFVPPSNPRLTNHGRFAVSVAPDASFDGTVTLQRRFGDSDGWKVVDTYTAAEESNRVDTVIGVQYRIGIDTGDISAGEVVVRLAK